MTGIALCLTIIGLPLGHRAFWQQAMTDWRWECRGLARGLADEGSLAEPWTVSTAADLLWSLMSVEFIDDLTTERGWSTDELTERLRLDDMNGRFLVVGSGFGRHPWV